MNAKAGPIENRPALSAAPILRNAISSSNSERPTPTPPARITALHAAGLPGSGSPQVSATAGSDDQQQTGPRGDPVRRTLPDIDQCQQQDPGAHEQDPDQAFSSRPLAEHEQSGQHGQREFQMLQHGDMVGSDLGEAAEEECRADDSAQQRHARQAGPVRSRETAAGRRQARQARDREGQHGDEARRQIGQAGGTHRRQVFQRLFAGRSQHAERRGRAKGKQGADNRPTGPDRHQAPRKRTR